MDIRAANREYERWLTAQLKDDIVAVNQRGNFAVRMRIRRVP